MKFIILFLVVFSVFSSSAQKNGLMLTKYKNQHTKFIKEGSRIHVRSKGTPVKGSYTILTDSTILVQTDTIPLSQISALRFKTLPIQLGGGSLLLAGSYLTAGGIYGIVALTEELAGLGFVAGLFLFSPLYVGGGLLAAGGVLMLVRGKKCSSAKWKYEITRSVPVTDPG